MAFNPVAFLRELAEDETDVDATAFAECAARIEELEAGYRYLHKYAPGAAQPWIEDQAEKLGVSLAEMGSEVTG